MSTTDDSQSTDLPGFLPAPIASAVTTTAQSTQTSSSDSPSFQSGSSNFIYIYSFLSTLFLLLCLAILVLLRALMRRRRLDRLFNSEGESSGGDTAQSTQRRRRQKKRPHVGSKPYMSDAWIGNGPVPTSLSTEALLETIQPFSIARAPEGTTTLIGKEKLVELPVLSEVEQAPKQKPRRLDFFSYGQTPSSSCCGAENEKSGVNSDNGHSSQIPVSPSITTPISPKLEVEQLCIGFLIAMPRQRTGLGSASSSSCLSASPSKETLGRNFDLTDGCSFADSRWTDRLCEGELPELSVGISTVYVPIDSPTRER